VNVVVSIAPRICGALPPPATARPHPPAGTHAGVANLAPGDLAEDGRELGDVLDRHPAELGGAAQQIGCGHGAHDTTAQRMVARPRRRWNHRSAMEVAFNEPERTTAEPQARRGGGDAQRAAAAPLTGHYHRVEAAVELPAGLDVVADGTDVGGTQVPTHHSVYPTESMTVEAFTTSFTKGIGWKHAGKR
jgi:hypothetical protein